MNDPMEIARALAEIHERDPQSFRDSRHLSAALADLVDTDTYAGELRLVVDAVELGALDRLRSLMEAGAEAEAAIESAADFLARARASDVAGARWACSALAYAGGGVSAAGVVARARAWLGGPEAETGPSSRTDERPPVRTGAEKGPVGPPPAGRAAPPAGSRNAEVTRRNPGLGPVQPPVPTGGLAPMREDGWRPITPPPRRRAPVLVAVVAVLVVAVVLALVVRGRGEDPPGGSPDGQAADGSADTEDDAGDTTNDQRPAGSGDCGEVDMAVNPWVGSVANAYVVGTLAEQELGCTVNYRELSETESWEGIGSGEVDVVIEDWGHPDLERRYLTGEGDGSATNLGATGNVGRTGWYVPVWLAEEHPEVLDYDNLNDLASDFATSETGSKGQFLGVDPSYVQFDEAIIENLGLDYEVVYSGSEQASRRAFQRAENNREFLIGYFYEPNWLFAELDLQKVALPPYEHGCQDDPADVACDYPEKELRKIVSTAWAEAGGPAVDLVQRFQWANADQDLVAKYIANDGMAPEDAAARWIEENEDTVDGWLG